MEGACFTPPAALEGVGKYNAYTLSLMKQALVYYWVSA